MISKMPAVGFLRKCGIVFVNKSQVAVGMQAIRPVDQCQLSTMSIDYILAEQVNIIY